MCPGHRLFTVFAYRGRTSRGLLPLGNGKKQAMSNPAISVAMSIYNGERFLSEAIESVLAQSFADFEFLIIDDGSRDATPDILHTYASADPRIVPIVRENRGLITSLNELLSRASAPLVARMDADDVCDPERFARQVAFLEANPDHGVVGTWSLDIGEDSLPLTGKGTDQPVTWKELRDGIEQGRQLICHPAAMLRRDIVLGVGGYHAAFRHCEDFDLWLRLASVTKMANIPERLLRYRRSPDQVSRRHATEQQFGSVIALLAYRERLAGRPDPTADLECLPPLDELDTLFGRGGVAREVREQLAFRLRYSPEALRDEGFDLIVRHLREGGRREGMWRTVVRLLKFGEPRRAMRLAATLATSG